MSRLLTGVCYLYVKTIERAHMPSKLWEKIKLSASFAEVGIVPIYLHAIVDTAACLL